MKRTIHQLISEQQRRLRAEAKIEIELSFALEDRTRNNVVSEKYSISYQITICFIFS
jgi:hypothetical protein